MSKCAAPSITSANAFDVEQVQAFASSKRIIATSSLENPSSASLMVVTIKNLTSGIIAGSCEALAGYPLETVKARMQTQPRRTNGLQYYSSMVDCIQQSVRDGGIASLYRGALPQIIRSAISASVLFGLMGQYRYFFDTKTPFRDRPRFSLVLAAMSTGLTESFLYTPFEVIKIRMQTQGTHSRKRISNVACIKAVYQQSGMRGFYRGMLPMAKKEMLGNAAYFVAYESSKTHLTELLHTMQSNHPTDELDSNKQRLRTYGAIATAGGIAGLVYWLAVFPIDTVKSVMQADTLQNPKYRDCDAEPNSHTWEQVCDINGNVFYVNHESKETCWEFPDDVPLPNGWQSMRDEQGRVFFVDHSRRITTWLDPRVYTPEEHAEQSDGQVDELKLRASNLEGMSAEEVENETKSSFNGSCEEYENCESEYHIAMDTFDFMSKRNDAAATRTPLQFIAHSHDKEELSLCRHCNTKFGVLRRRHHCRLCGCVYCSDCLSTKVRLPPATLSNPSSMPLQDAVHKSERQQAICPRCARNVAGGQFFSILGAYRCLHRANEPSDVLALSITERTHLMSLVTQAFRQSREESGAGMGAHHLAELNDIDAAGGVATFCKLLSPVLDHWTADQSPKIAALLSETLEMLTELMTLQITAGNDTQAGSAFSSAGTCEQLVAILSKSAHDSNENITRNTLRLIFRVCKFRYCQISLRKADCGYWLKNLLGKGEESKQSSGFGSRMDIAKCVRAYIKNNRENAIQFASIQGIEALFRLLEELFFTTNRDKKFSCVNPLTRAMGITLKTLFECLQFIERVTDDPCARGTLSKKMTVGDLLPVWQDTSPGELSGRGTTKAIKVQLTEAAVKSLVLCFFNGFKQLRASALPVIKALSNSVELLRCLAQENSHDSLIFLLDTLQTCFSPASAQVALEESFLSGSRVENIPDYQVASDILCRLCTSFADASLIQSDDERTIWLNFLSIMEERGGLEIVVKCIDTFTSKERDLTAEELEFYRSLIGIVYGFAQASDDRLSDILCGETTSGSQGCLRGLSACLSSKYSGIWTICAETLLAVLKNASACEKAWKVLCGESRKERDLLCFFQNWLLVTNDTARQRLAIQFYRSWLGSTPNDACNDKSMPDSVLQAIFHLFVTNTNSDLRMQCLTLVLDLLERLPSALIKIYDHLTEQACFVPLMQILCALSNPHLREARANKFAPSFLLMSPSVTFKTDVEETHAQWTVWKCINLMVPEPTATTDDDLDSRNEDFITSLDNKLRARTERLTERMLEGSVLQAICTALWNTLIHVTCTDMDTRELTNCQVWCEALLNLLVRILAHVPPTSEAKIEHQVVNLSTVLAQIIASGLLEAKTDERYKLLCTILQLLRRLSSCPEWRCNYLALVITLGNTRKAVEKCSTGLLEILLELISDDLLIDDSLLVLEAIGIEATSSQESTCTSEFEEYITRVNLPHTLLDQFCKIVQKTNLQQEKSVMVRLRLVSKTIASFSHLKEFQQVILSDHNASRHIVAFYANSKDKWASLNDISGHILALLSRQPAAFRQLVHNLGDLLPMKILDTLVATSTTKVLIQQRTTAETIVINLADSDFPKCPLWSHCILSRNVNRLVTILTSCLDLKVQVVAAKKLTGILHSVMLEGKQQMLQIMDKLVAGSAQHQGDWILTLIELLSSHEFDVETSSVGLDALGTLVSYSVSCKTDKKLHSVLETKHMHQLANGSSSAFLYWLHEGSERQQQMVINILSDGIQDRKLRAFFFDGMFLSQIESNASGAQFFVSAVVEQVQKLNTMYWKQLSSATDSAHSSDINNANTLILPICKRCEILCECLQHIGDVMVTLGAQGITLLKDLSRTLLRWIEYTTETHFETPHRITLAILRFLHQETLSLGLCRTLVEIDTAPCVIRLLRTKSVVGNDEVLEGLSLLKMMCIVDLGGFIQSEGIDLLLFVVKSGIEKHYDDGGDLIALEAIDMLSFISKSTTAGVDLEGPLWENMTCLTSLHASVSQLGDTLHAIADGAPVESDTLSGMSQSDIAWVDVLFRLVTFTFTFWSASNSFSFEKSNFRIQQRVYDVVYWMSALCATESENDDGKAGCDITTYCELMTSALPVLELALIGDDSKHNVARFQSLRGSTIRALKIAALQQAQTINQELGKLIIITCDTMISVFNHSIATQRNDMSELADQVLGLLKILAGSLGEQGDIMAFIELTNCLWPHLGSSSEREWIVEWLLRIISVAEVGQTTPGFCTWIGVLLLKLLLHTTLRRKVLEDERLSLLVMYLKEQNKIIYDRVLVKVLRLLGEAPSLVEELACNVKAPTTKFVTRCYYCQQVVTIEMDTVHKWREGDLPRCLYCQQAIVMAGDTKILSASSQFHKGLTVSSCKGPSGSQFNRSRRNTIESFAASFHHETEKPSIISRNSCSMILNNKSHFDPYNSIGAAPERELASSYFSLESKKIRVMECAHCKEHLVIRSGATALRCPSCHEVSQVSSTDSTTVLRCRECNALISIPVGATAYKCIKCLHTTKIT
uniref:Mitochondrial Carrier (MC) Family putative n=1 Tax=Albugo laibachii Nc14 TaxID=890382 RepID=F0WIN2_9STRA|nr:Mitochondrial Carrier (MC) Family putative [Albugo laibachii Nc14]|eukprot:CCA21123.1 Mitochondrial Carrier (MC) Family putative [Albugo laibachii Nc14]